MNEGELLYCLQFSILLQRNNHLIGSPRKLFTHGGAFALTHLLNNNALSPSSTPSTFLTQHHPLCIVAVVRIHHVARKRSNSSAPPPAPPVFTANPAAAAASGPKNDIFVGNLAFNTTEEQLYQALSDIGRFINVRLVTDVETGKPRGFAFVEFQDAQAAFVVHS